MDMDLSEKEKYLYKVLINDYFMSHEKAKETILFCRKNFGTLPMAHCTKADLF